MTSELATPGSRLGATVIDWLLGMVPTVVLIAGLLVSASTENGAPFVVSILGAFGLSIVLLVKQIAHWRHGQTIFNRL